ncbi:C-type lectin domain family 4 member M-like isoform X2 [Thunnus albacares]|uniref:C-type lectin domain family 4 member M-like isoform X2 n=1 Tax=Thunnus albacares TaxID=8236 RepID=UPI001CF7045C|nr:C-type lectin domain family 4 member M-like isoform X2 [Thunnus albacares]
MYLSNPSRSKLVLSRNVEDGEDGEMMAAAEPGRKPYRVVVVCLGVLCILQAALNISLCLALYHSYSTSYKYLTEERDTLKRNQSDCDKKTLDLEASFKTLTEERDELKKKLTDLDHSDSTSYKHLTEERDTLKRNQSDCDKKTADLEASFKTLTEERDELKKNLTDFDHSHSTSYKHLTEERDTLNRNLSDCDKKTADLEASFKTLTEERDELKKNLTDFDHSHSTSYKHLTEERDTLNRNLSDCDKKTADLEASFKTLTEERDELKKNLTDFDKKTADLEASFKTLTEERDELRKKLTDFDKKTADLEASFKTLTEERDELKKNLTDFDHSHSTSYKRLTEERDTLKRNLTDCDNKTLDLEASFKTLTEERDELKKKLPDFVHYSQQGWKYFNGSFYYISSNIKTWNESRTDCLQRGADLVVVNSRDEQEFINRYQKMMWIGLTDSEREGTWKWVDGTPLTTSFWDSGEPNNNNNEDCVETRFYPEETGWNDIICGERRLWICEKKMFL